MDLKQLHGLRNFRLRRLEGASEQGTHDGYGAEHQEDCDAPLQTAGEAVFMFTLFTFKNRD